MIGHAAVAAESRGDDRPVLPGKEIPAALRWAYPVRVRSPAQADDGKLRRVAGSAREYTLTQIRDNFAIMDWFPEEHPPTPPVVTLGRKPQLIGCAHCHMPGGQGFPHNASVAGLPADYILRQIADIKAGTRLCAEPRMEPPTHMQEVSRQITAEEARIAAEYYARIPYRAWIKVVEAETVPVARVFGLSMYVAFESEGREPLGRRILEVPADAERTKLQDPHSGFIAHVPVGSIKRGETLAATGGGGRTVQCATCHGPELKGLGVAPPIAGRSPSYLVRQLYELQSGVRNGTMAVLMKPTVVNLTPDDMIDLAAYVSSRAP